MVENSKIKIGDKSKLFTIKSQEGFKRTDRFTHKFNGILTYM